MEEPELDPQEPQDLDPAERENIEADLDDLSGMKIVFAGQGVRGVVIACPDCGSNHFYEWDLLRESLEHMLKTGEPRMHEPAFEPREDEYIQWTTARATSTRCPTRASSPIGVSRSPPAPGARHGGGPLRLLPAVRPFARGAPSVSRARGPRHRRAGGSLDARPRRLRAFLATNSDRLRVAPVRVIVAMWLFDPSDAARDGHRSGGARSSKIVPSGRLNS